MTSFTYIGRHFNPETVFEDTQKAMVNASRHEPWFLYINPIASVFTSDPTPEFFKFVRQRQAQWCKRARTEFGRTNFRSVGTTFTGWERNKWSKFMTRSLLYVGQYAINGQPVPNHVWRKAEDTACSMQKNILAT